jgi:hypothetical protein
VTAEVHKPAPADSGAPCVRRDGAPESGRSVDTFCMHGFFRIFCKSLTSAPTQILSFFQPEVYVFSGKVDAWLMRAYERVK